MTRKSFVKKLYMESFIVAVCFFTVVTIALIGVYFVLGDTVEIFVDGKKQKFDSVEDIQLYMNKNLPQEIVIKNSVVSAKNLEIPLSSIGASYFSAYDMDIITKKINSSLSSKLSAFFWKKENYSDIIVDSRRIYYETEEIGKFIVSEINALNYQAIDAKIIEKGEKLQVEPERKGVAFDALELFNVIEKGLKSGNITNLKITARAISPKIKKEDLLKYKEKKAIVVVELPSEYWKNNVAEILLNKLNNTVIPGKKPVELKKNYYLNLQKIASEYSFSREDEEYMFKVADKIFEILKDALIEADFPVRENDSKSELRTFVPIKKDVLISGYLEGNKVKIMIAMVA